MWAHNLDLEFVRVTEATALASARLMGRGDEAAAQKAAVTTMHDLLSRGPLRCRVVVGEGEPGQVSRLANGEILGDGEEAVADVALDALEGTNICASGRPNSISVMAVTEPGGFLATPDVYMEKIIVGPKAKGTIDLSLSPTENLQRIAEARQCYVEDLTVVVLDRPRHERLIKEIREAGAKLRLIGDGDLSAAIATAVRDSGIDVLMGIGGAAQGLLAAAALKGMNGDMQGRFLTRSEAERAKVQRLVQGDVHQILSIDELVPGHDALFVATGITDGDVLKGVRLSGKGATTHSLAIRCQTGTIRFIQTEHRFLPT
jgi:fructose-1,6-bisphosphatase class II